MTIPAEVLTEHLSAVREATLTVLLEAQAKALNSGAEIEPEPIRRNPAGDIKRDGQLDLPSRGDLRVTRPGRTLIEQYQGGTVPVFRPLQAYANPDFSADLHPFTWDRAVLDIRSEQIQPAWTPLRHWFLEWFQTRPTDLTPDLCGAVHRLDGPHSHPGGWRITVDLGSAPTSCVPAMIAAIGLSGCSRLRITDD